MGELSWAMTKDPAMILRMLAASLVFLVLPIAAHGQNDAASAERLRQACEGGDAVSCNNLGFMYSNGQGVRQDEARGTALYRQACDAGVQQACTNHAIMQARQQSARSSELYRNMPQFTPPQTLAFDDVETIRQDALNRIAGMGRDLAPALQRTPGQARQSDAGIYYNPHTARYSIGGTEFGAYDFDAVLRAHELYERGDVRPQGGGWRAIAPVQFEIHVMRAQSADRNIFNNCSRERLRGANRTEISIRRECFRVAEDPSFYDRIRWGN